ncbi:unnamed protein product [Ilex paraguariensis]|uniref:Uncharacterized protein n=1 Tax=Ilex paraguariensis TaxID=185542 RepID=A0ABC8SEL7_9AQUA
MEQKKGKEQIVLENIPEEEEVGQKVNEVVLDHKHGVDDNINLESIAGLFLLCSCSVQLVFYAFQLGCSCHFAIDWSHSAGLLLLSPGAAQQGFSRFYSSWFLAGFPTDFSVFQLVFS